MADTQVLEHSGGSGLDHENRLLWGMFRACELCLSTDFERYRWESRDVAVESFIRKCTAYKFDSASSFIFPFFLRFFISLELNL